MVGFGLGHPEGLSKKARDTVFVSREKESTEAISL